MNVGMYSLSCGWWQENWSEGQDEDEAAGLFGGGTEEEVIGGKGEELFKFVIMGFGNVFIPLRFIENSGLMSLIGLCNG